MSLPAGAPLVLEPPPVADLSVRAEWPGHELAGLRLFVSELGDPAVPRDDWDGELLDERVQELGASGAVEIRSVPAGRLALTLADPRGWGAVLAHEELELAPGETRTLVLRVEPDAGVGR